MLIIALFIIVINEKQPKYPPAKKKTQKTVKKNCSISIQWNNSNKKQQGIEI